MMSTRGRQDGIIVSLNADGSGMVQLKFGTTRIGFDPEATSRLRRDLLKEGAKVRFCVEQLGSKRRATDLSIVF